jgi:hypothetical protein
MGFHVGDRVKASRDLGGGIFGGPSVEKGTEGKVVGIHEGFLNTTYDVDFGGGLFGGSGTLSDLQDSDLESAGWW